MAIDDLPMPVVNLLNVIGAPWPYVNEDTVLRFASLVRNFGIAVETTYQDATAAIKAIGRAHQGASTGRMTSGRASMSEQHVTELVAGRKVLSSAGGSGGVHRGAEGRGDRGTCGDGGGVRGRPGCLGGDAGDRGGGRVLDHRGGGEVGRVPGGRSRVRQTTGLRRSHAATLRGHGETFQQGVRGLGF